jgi:hypothetical protein
MTPLMSTLYHIRNNQQAALKLLEEQMPVLLQDVSPRRINVLKMPEGDRRVLDPTFVDYIAKLDSASDLWLVYGYEAITSLVYYLLKQETTFSFKHDADAVGQQFLKKVLERLPATVRMLPSGFPKRRTPLPGIYFRLFTDGGVNTQVLVPAIRDTVSELAKPGSDVERTVKQLRCTVPLPHDEAYKNKPIGKFQNCFMLCCDPTAHASCSRPPVVFWQYMGQRIAERLFQIDPLQ